MTTTADPTLLYGPIREDLPLVEELLRSLTDVEFPWLREMLQATLAGGGKQLRPAIALLTGRLGEYRLDLLVPMAASVELLHTATLVHDDVIDAADERRGRPTAAALFNNAPSVMLGDYLFAHAAEFVAVEVEAQLDRLRRRRRHGDRIDHVLVVEARVRIFVAVRSLGL